MIFHLLNVRNNQYNKTLEKALFPQKSGHYLVNGKYQEYKPKNDYYSESPRLIELAKKAKGNPTAMGLLGLNRMPRMKKGTLEWAPSDKRPRAPVNPTSSALQDIRYDSRASKVTFKFRNNPKFYSALMSAPLYRQWMSSPSIGRFFNANLRGRL